MQSASEPIHVKSAAGSYYITKDNKKILDAISSWWVITHGHCHPHVTEAITKTASEIDQIQFAQFKHKHSDELIEELSLLTNNSFYSCFFSDNGSTAVEVALKMSVQAQRQKGQNRNKILSFKHSYHGDTVGAMSISEKSLFTDPYKDFLFKVIQADHPTNPNSSIEEFTEPFLKKFNQHKNEVAAVIIEPLIQGASGMVMWPEEALKIICQEVKKSDCYLIFDEVMTGFGRTGEVFAYEAVGIVPDLLCLSKGLTNGNLPLSLTLAQEEIYEAFLDSKKDKMFFHGHSFTGNPLSCAAATANLKVINNNKQDFLNKISLLHQVHLSGIEQIKNSSRVTNTRVKGAIAAFEIDSDTNNYSSNLSQKVTDYFISKGIYLRPLGNTLYILPPYCTTKKELEKIWEEVNNFINLKN